MSDIFLNYVLNDAIKASKLVVAFLVNGWTVRQPNPSDLVTYALTERTNKELKGAKVIVTLWSQDAARLSSIVGETLERSQALPVVVLLDKHAAPLPELVSVRSFDLSDWDGDASHAELKSLQRHLSTLIDPSSAPAKPPASLDELSLSEIQEDARRAIEKSATAPPKDDARFSGVFISYRRKEAAAYAGRLYDRLVARFGKERVFIDTENVGVGRNFVKAIKAAADSCAVMVALISREWQRAVGDAEDGEDDYVRLEIATALGREIPLIPITIQGASMPRRRELPNDLAPLAHINAFELRDVRWERDVEDLIRDLEKLLND